jgi:hypothetical protein
MMRTVFIIIHEFELVESLFTLNTWPTRSRNSRKIKRNSGFKSNTIVSDTNE